MGVFKGHILRSLKHLDHGLVLVQFYDAADAPLISVYDKLHDLIEEGVLQPLQRDQRAVDTAKSKIFYWHTSLLPLLRIFLQHTLIETVDVTFILCKHFQSVIGYIVLDGNDPLKDIF